MPVTWLDVSGQGWMGRLAPLRHPRNKCVPWFSHRHSSTLPTETDPSRRGRAGSAQRHAQATGDS